MLVLTRYVGERALMLFNGHLIGTVQPVEMPTRHANRTRIGFEFHPDIKILKAEDIEPRQLLALDMLAAHAKGGPVAAINKLIEHKAMDALNQMER